MRDLLGNAAFALTGVTIIVAALVNHKAGHRLRAFPDHEGAPWATAALAVGILAGLLLGWSKGQE